VADRDDEISLKIRLIEKKYETERLMREKRSEEMQTLEEVFDKSTLMIIYRMLNTGVLERIFGVVKAGKESRLYWGKDANDKDIAIKIYLVTSSEFRKGMLKYIEGDNRFRNVPKSTRSLIYLWAKKEFKNLLLAKEVGISSPKPITVEGNVLLMEFIGEEGVSAPLLRDYQLKRPARVYRLLLRYVKSLYKKANLVHGDLSEYNIMVWNDKPVIFDFSQAIKLEHPLSHELLRRDLTNLNGFFEKFKIKIESVDGIYEKIVGSHR
jgi:RIO kinase 1